MTGENEGIPESRTALIPNALTAAYVKELEDTEPAELLNRSSAEDKAKASACTCKQKAALDRGDCKPKCPTCTDAALSVIAWAHRMKGGKRREQLNEKATDTGSPVSAAAVLPKPKPAPAVRGKHDGRARGVGARKVGRKPR